MASNRFQSLLGFINSPCLQHNLLLRLTLVQFGLLLASTGSPASNQDAFGATGS